MDWGLVAAIGGFAITILGGVVAWSMRFSKAESSSETARTALTKAESLEKELAIFKLEVTRNYATAEMVAQVDRSVGEAINRLADRIDRLIETRTPTRRRTSG